MPGKGSPTAASAPAAPGASDEANGASNGVHVRKWANFRHICGVAVYQEEEVRV